jgi:hypothetical protein
MSKFFIAAAVATTALTAAAPAAAQYYPAQGYGYNNGGGLVRSYIVRADQLRQRIDRLDGRDRVSEREARQLRRAAADLQARTRDYARNGLNNRERYELDQRFAQLQQAMRYERRDGDNRRGWEGNGRDRDRDGRVDRYEDDRGRYPG